MDTAANPHPNEQPGRIRLGPGVFIHESDLQFSATRASGPGGQNVNKRSTRVEMRIAIDAIPLDPGARRRLIKLAGSQVIGGEELLIASQDERSQKRNKDDCLQKLRELVVKALVRPKPRIRTKPGRGAIERRLTEKKQHAEKKRRRRPPPANGG